MPALVNRPIDIVVCAAAAIGVQLRGRQQSHRRRAHRAAPPDVGPAGMSLQNELASTVFTESCKKVSH